MVYQNTPAVPVTTVQRSLLKHNLTLLVFHNKEDIMVIDPPLNVPTKTEYDGQMNNKPTTVINKNVNGRKSVKSNHDISSAISIIVSSF